MKIITILQYKKFNNFNKLKTEDVNQEGEITSKLSLLLRLII